MIGMLFGKGKMIFIALIVIGIASAYHFYTVNSLNSEVKQAQEQIIIVEAENTELRVENRAFSEQVNIISQTNENNIAKFKAESERKDAVIEVYMEKSVALQEKYTVSVEKSNELRETLAKHDLEYLASMKPGLIESRINKGTASVFNAFKEVTSSE